MRIIDKIGRVLEDKGVIKGFTSNREVCNFIYTPSHVIKGYLVTLYGNDREQIFKIFAFFFNNDISIAYDIVLIVDRRDLRFLNNLKNMIEKDIPESIVEIKERNTGIMLIIKIYGGEFWLLKLRWELIRDIYNWEDVIIESLNELKSIIK